jgi:predicted permease
LETVNRLNLDVFIPALVFSALSRQGFDPVANGKLAFAGIAVFLLPGLIAWPVARLLRIQPKTLVPPVMFCNAGNMGLPLMTLAFGEKALPAALVLFLLGNLMHFGLGAYILNRRAPLIKILAQPALIAAALGLSLSSLEIILPKAISLPVDMLGQIAVPIMLFSLGVRIAYSDLSEWKVGVLGALLSPAAGIAAAALMLALFDLPPMQAGVLLLFGALPPAVMNFLFAERYRQEPAKVAAIVVLGNLFSVLSLPLVLAYVLPRYA